MLGKTLETVRNLVAQDGTPPFLTEVRPSQCDVLCEKVLLWNVVVVHAL